MNKLKFYFTDGHSVDIELDPIVRFSVQEDLATDELVIALTQKTAFETDALKNLWDNMKINKISAKNINKIQCFINENLMKESEKAIESINYLIDYNGEQYSEKINIIFY